jgi:glycosyltransferase involved in cell wall biosynthesis
MRSGTPVITSSVSSLPEIVGDAGFLVDPDDVRRLGGSILAHLVQDKLHAEMSQKAQQRAAEFSPERTAAQTVEVYQHVLSGV